jgi:hypothetical protein
MGFFVFLVLAVVVIIVVSKFVKENKRNEAIEELKKSDNYAFALELANVLDQMGKEGYGFKVPQGDTTEIAKAYAGELVEVTEQIRNSTALSKEPYYIGINPKHDNQAYAIFGSSINIPSEAEKSHLSIHTTVYIYEHEQSADYAVRHSKCVLDLGMTLVYSDDKSKELIDFFWGLFIYASVGANLYVNGQLIVSPSDHLPVYPRETVLPDNVPDYEPENEPDYDE